MNFTRLLEVAPKTWKPLNGYQEGGGKERRLCPKPTNQHNFQKYVGVPISQMSNVTTRKPLRDPSPYPFLGNEIWNQVADQRRVFNILNDYPINMTALKEWVNVQPHPITLLISNYFDMDYSFPKRRNGDEQHQWEDLIQHYNIKSVYSQNRRLLWENQPKVKPLPLGLKWHFQEKYKELYGKSSSDLHMAYSQVSKSPQDTKHLFENERPDSVWLRPLTDRIESDRYIRYNDAMSIKRSNLKPLLERIAPNTVVVEEKMLNQTEYFQELERHRFVVSPIGVGLDSHGTWEALLAGAIPIVPQSSLDQMFEDLPVWIVSSWDEVTDAAVVQKSKEFRSRTYNWDKVFVEGWKDEIYSELCRLPSDT